MRAYLKQVQHIYNYLKIHNPVISTALITA